MIAVSLQADGVQCSSGWLDPLWDTLSTGWSHTEQGRSKDATKTSTKA